MRWESDKEGRQDVLVAFKLLLLLVRVATYWNTTAAANLIEYLQRLHWSHKRPERRVCAPIYTLSI